MDRYYSQVTRPGIATDVSRTSSVYSVQSEEKSSSPLADVANGSGRASRTTYTPSFMSHHATHSTDQVSISKSADLPDGQHVVRRPVPAPGRLPPNASLQVPAVPSPLQAPPGVLLLLVAAVLPPSTMFYVKMLLERQEFSSISIAALEAQEPVARELKMDIYALVGRMGKELGVALHIRKEWNGPEIGSVLLETTKSGYGLQGVLCCPDFSSPDSTGSSILDTSEVQMLQAWEQSVAFLHASVRTTLQSLLSRCTLDESADNGRPLKPSSPFFLVIGSDLPNPVAQVNKAGCDNLVNQLCAANMDRGLTVGYTELMLVPDPALDTSIKAGPSLVPDSSFAYQHNEAFTPTESPTRLWNMWSMQNDPDYEDEG